MEIYSIDTDLFKLDGGAMFGVVPKVLWEKVLPADERNMCDLAMRLLLIKEGKRLILIDTGIGKKQDERFLSRYYLHGGMSLEGSLQKYGFNKADITDVFLTHLHFDHVGGAIEREEETGKLVPAFPNATYWSNQLHWDWAISPNAREKASFLHENLLPLEKSGKLKFVPTMSLEEQENLWDPDYLWSDQLLPFTANISYKVVGGHTRGMMIPYIKVADKTIVYVADLIPTMGHFPLPYIASFDVFPLLAMEEKDLFLKQAIDNNYILFFEHDAVNQCCTVKINEKGKVVPREIFNLEDLMHGLNP